MNTKRFCSPIARKAAGLALGLILPATLAQAFIFEDFESDTVGGAPANASFTAQKVDSRVDVEIVDGVNHHFPTGSQSLMLRNDADPGTPIAGFAGSLPAAGIAGGSLTLDFFPISDGTVPFPSVDVRLGNNGQTSAMGGNDIAVWFRTWRHGDGREFMQVREGGAFKNFDVSQNFMDYNSVNSLQIDFANAEFEVSLNGVLLSIDGQNSFAMHESLTHINHLNLVSGNNATTGSEVHYDNLSLIPEPSTYAMFLGLGALGALGFRSRMRRSAAGKD